MFKVCSKCGYEHSMSDVPEPAFRELGSRVICADVKECKRREKEQTAFYKRAIKGKYTRRERS